MDPTASAKATAACQAAALEKKPSRGGGTTSRGAGARQVPDLPRRRATKSGRRPLSPVSVNLHHCRWSRSRHRPTIDDMRAVIMKRQVPRPPAVLFRHRKSPDMWRLEQPIRGVYGGETTGENAQLIGARLGMVIRCSPRASPPVRLADLGRSASAGAPPARGAAARQRARRSPDSRARPEGTRAVSPQRRPGAARQELGHGALRQGVARRSAHRRAGRAMQSGTMTVNRCRPRRWRSGSCGTVCASRRAGGCCDLAAAARTAYLPLSFGKGVDKLGLARRRTKRARAQGPPARADLDRWRKPDRAKSHAPHAFTGADPVEPRCDRGRALMQRSRNSIGPVGRSSGASQAR